MNTPSESAASVHGPKDTRADRSPLWDAELIGGPETREIVIVDHDPSWRDRFETHRLRISDVLGAAAQRIEHVGSTSVPGLAAKPIIDIQISVADPEHEPAYVPALEGASNRRHDEMWNDSRTRAHWDRVIDVNLNGVVNALLAIYPGMVERGSGHIAPMNARALRWFHRLSPGLTDRLGVAIARRIDRQLLDSAGKPR